MKPGRARPRALPLHPGLPARCAGKNGIPKGFALRRKMWEAEPPARLPKLSRAAILPHGDVRCKAKLDATAPAAPCGPQATAQGQSPCKKPGRPFAARRKKSQTALLPSGELAYVQPPRKKQAQSAPAAPTGAAVHGLRAKPLGVQGVSPRLVRLGFCGSLGRAPARGKPGSCARLD